MDLEGKKMLAYGYFQHGEDSKIRFEIERLTAISKKLNEYHSKLFSEVLSKKKPTQKQSHLN